MSKFFCETKNYTVHIFFTKVFCFFFYFYIEMILYFLSTKLRPFHNVLTNFETVIYLAAAKYGTVSPCHVKNQNGPIFCSRKI